MPNNICIVDDDAQITRLLQSVTQSVGLNSSIYRSAEDFLRIHHTANEIILLDLSMPKTDGIEVLRSLARYKCQSIIILMSGYADNVLHSAKELACALNLRCVAGLSKPIQIKALTTLLLRLSGNEPADGFSSKTDYEYWTPSKQELLTAIQNYQFELVYQAKIDIQAGRLAGAEALSRWHHPEKGVLQPNKFIPLIEHHGLMDNFTHYVIKRALNELKTINCSDVLPSLSLNISSSYLHKLSLPEVMSEAFGSGPLPPTNIYLELTESELMDELVTSLDILTRLCLKGFKISIDDFGIGYSSLSKLHHAPFSELKIDKSFIKTMKSDKESLAIVETCIFLAHKLDMVVTAEGVEDEATAELLNFLRCDYIQGYYYGEPLAFEEFINWANFINISQNPQTLTYTPDLFSPRRI